MIEMERKAWVRGFIGWRFFFLSSFCALENRTDLYFFVEAF